MYIAERRRKREQWPGRRLIVLDPSDPFDLLLRFSSARNPRGRASRNYSARDHLQSGCESPATFRLTAFYLRERAEP
jgi:hypothetical protein